MSAAQDAPPRADLPALTGVRAFAALWVLLFHAQWFGLWEAFPGAAVAAPLVRCGYLGVDLFFVLSGFILTHTYAENLRTLSRAGYLRYLAARFARVYPAHLAVMLAMGAWVAVARLGWAPGPWAGARYRAPEFVGHLALLQATGLTNARAWNVPSWSISAEWCAYLVFPLACGALTRVRGAAACLVGAALALAAVVAAVPLLRFGDTLDTTATGGLVRIAGEFTAGALLCRAAAALRGRRVPWGWIATAAAGAALGLAVAGRGDPWCLFAFGALVLALAAGEGPVARLLATPAAVVGGRMSYALYLIHMPVLGTVGWALGRHVDPAWSGPRLWGWIALYALAPVAAAFLLWRGVEEPARRAIRAWTDRRLGTAAAPRDREAQRPATR